MFSGAICRRANWLLRLSIVLNVCVVLLFVGTHFRSSGPWVEEPPAGWAGSTQDALLGTAMRPGATGTSGSSVTAETSKTDGARTKTSLSSLATSSSLASSSSSLAAQVEANRTKLASAETASEVDRAKANQTANQKPELTLQEAIECNDKPLNRKTSQRGDYWVLYNYVPMSEKPHCWESVTYTTHADYTFLDNLEPLLDRWRAPISIALHAPGGDFPPTIEAIKYARTCAGPLVSRYVTFHVYFSSKHMPKYIPSGDRVSNDRANCSKPAPWANVSVASMYKTERKLLYPVNVGRNVARESASTRYVLASDIELYPSPELPANFLEMVRRKAHPALSRPNPKVFVLSIFEVDEKSQPPRNKTALMQMLKTGSLIPFHKKLCSGCHNVPRAKEWQEAKETRSLSVFHIGKRTGSFVHWEPIYIGTNDDPLYDERLSWEGKSDKMTQGYALCVLNYDFLILDNAFLVHRPGIKVYKKDAYRDTLTAKTNVLIKKIITPELKVLYGTKKGCAV
ncbi:beta-1,4-glucuronyltransferase 1 [Copidosoma floridanum]|uniref:beta-1,4-glucuronyltransferase 1 n=1 Tax=Copidosoma floridanum TaxID=29053 RepID=UPI0006C99990|nr:beta-1,4-glucuronyltransferase 1 [Copidosoma floridanum]XP_014208241.1 beta-1,4-glucuronyltransferase 1 [Copidosoma floridanum]XP_023246886.1 beta-1,4-glucuronyltransferase 1 [Copidosoma floridanum]